jgi:hypothetical protein
MPETILIEGEPHIPRMYTVDVVFNVDSQGVINPGVSRQGSELIQNIPFKLTEITWGVVGLTNLEEDYQFAFQNLADPFWQCTWKTDQHVYMSDPTLLQLAFGTVNHWLQLPAVVTLKPKTTVTFLVTNLALRSDVTTLQFCLRGGEPLELIDELK